MGKVQTLSRSAKKAAKKAAKREAKKRKLESGSSLEDSSVMTSRMRSEGADSPATVFERMVSGIANVDTVNANSDVYNDANNDANNSVNNDINNDANNDMNSDVSSVVGGGLDSYPDMMSFI